MYAVPSLCAGLVGVRLARLSCRRRRRVVGGRARGQSGPSPPPPGPALLLAPRRDPTFYTALPFLQTLHSHPLCSAVALALFLSPPVPCDLMPPLHPIICCPRSSVRAPLQAASVPQVCMLPALCSPPTRCPRFFVPASTPPAGAPGMHSTAACAHSLLQTLLPCAVLCVVCVLVALSGRPRPPWKTCLVWPNYHPPIRISLPLARAAPRRRRRAGMHGIPLR